MSKYSIYIYSLMYIILTLAKCMQQNELQISGYYIIIYNVNACKVEVFINPYKEASTAIIYNIKTCKVQVIQVFINPYKETSTFENSFGFLQGICKIYRHYIYTLIKRYDMILLQNIFGFLSGTLLILKMLKYYHFVTFSLTFLGFFGNYSKTYMKIVRV